MLYNSSDRRGHWAWSVTEVSPAGCNGKTGRVRERHKSGCPLATSHTDDCFIVNSALWNQMMNATQLQAHLSVTLDQLKPFTSVWSALDDLQGYLPTPPGTGFIVLHGPGSIMLEDGPVDPSTSLS